MPFGELDFTRVLHWMIVGISFYPATAMPSKLVREMYLYKCRLFYWSHKVALLARESNNCLPTFWSHHWSKLNSTNQENFSSSYYKIRNRKGPLQLSQYWFSNIQWWYDIHLLIIFLTQQNTQDSCHPTILQFKRASALLWHLPLDQMSSLSCLGKKRRQAWTESLLDLSLYKYSFFLL